MRRILMMAMVVLVGLGTAMAAQTGTGTGTGDGTGTGTAESLRAQARAIYQAARAEAAEAETPEQRRAIYQLARQQIQQLIDDAKERPAGTQIHDRDRDRDRICEEDPALPTQDRKQLRDEKDAATDRRRDRDCDSDGDSTDDVSDDEPVDGAAATLSGSVLMLDVLELTQEQKQKLARIESETRTQLQDRIRAMLTEQQQAQLEAAHKQAGQAGAILGPKGDCLQDRTRIRIWEALELTEEQQAFIQETMEAARAAVQAAETAEEKQQIMEQAHDAILSVLTEEQLALLEQIRTMLQAGERRTASGIPGIPGILADLDLTEDQIAFIQETLAAAREAAAAAETPEAKREIMQEAHELILTVLTDEQLEQLQSAMGDCQPDRPVLGLPPAFDELGLTEEQLAAIADIREAAKIAAEAADTPEARREIMEAAHQAILDVLTEEQLALLEQMQGRLLQIRERNDGESANDGGSTTDPAGQGGRVTK